MIDDDVMLSVNNMNILARHHTLESAHAVHHHHAHCRSLDRVQFRGTTEHERGLTRTSHGALKGTKARTRTEKTLHYTSCRR